MQSENNMNNIIMLIKLANCTLTFEMHLKIKIWGANFEFESANCCR
jgi:hypothetical protein